jgi:hypothetical protein
VICINAIWFGIEADYRQHADLYDAHPVFIASSNFFCAYFTGEWLVRILAFEKKQNAFKDGWLIFDTFLVATMVLDVWGVMVALKLFTNVHGAKLPTQPFRILRLFKLTRMARLMKVFPELVIMIKGLGRAMRAIASSFLLVTVMTYVWGIILHMLLMDYK